jgi:hypothetical protein
MVAISSGITQRYLLGSAKAADLRTKDENR